MLAQSLLQARSAILPAVFAAACMLSGCSDGGGDYPSLASRPAERSADPPQPAASDSPNAAPMPVTTAPSAELAVRLTHLVEQAQSAHRGFGETRSAAEKSIGAAGKAPVGSEEWARGTQALSGLESARSLTAQPLADLDRIETDDHLAHPGQTGGGGLRPDAVAIAQARETVSALVADEDAVLAKLDGTLAR